MTVGVVVGVGLGPGVLVGVGVSVAVAVFVGVAVREGVLVGVCVDVAVKVGVVVGGVVTVGLFVAVLADCVCAIAAATWVATTASLGWQAATIKAIVPTKVTEYRGFIMVVPFSVCNDLPHQGRWTHLIPKLIRVRQRRG